MVIYCFVDDKFFKMVVIIMFVFFLFFVICGYIFYDISIYGDLIFFIMILVFINNVLISIIDLFVIFIRMCVIFILIFIVFEGYMILCIMFFNVIFILLILENVFLMMNIDKSFDKGIGDEFDYLFILIVMFLFFIMSVLVLRLKCGKNVNIVDKLFEMKNMDEIEE